jgi:hypothetical protein
MVRLGPVSENKALGGLHLAKARGPRGCRPQAGSPDSIGED